MIPATQPQEFQLRFRPSDGISTVRFSPESPDLLLVSSWDSFVHLYHVGENVEKAKYSHTGPVLDCVLVNDRIAYSGGLDKEIKRFDFEKNMEVKIGEHDQAIRKLEYSQQHNLVFSGSWDSTCKVWNENSQNPVATLKLPSKVFAMSVSHNRLVVGTSSRGIYIYDLRKLPDPEQIRESSLKFQTRAVACFTDGEGFALSSVEGRVSMEYFDPSPESQSRKFAFKCHRITNNGVDDVYPVNALAFHPIGTFATGGGDGYVNVWDGETKKRVFQFRRFPTSISSLSFNRTGNYLAIASSYTYEQGEINPAPQDEIFIRHIKESDVKSKAKST